MSWPPHSKKYRLRNDLYCVEWGVKLYSLTHPTQKSWRRHWHQIWKVRMLLKTILCVIAKKISILVHYIWTYSTPKLAECIWGHRIACLCANWLKKPTKTRKCKKYSQTSKESQVIVLLLALSVLQFCELFVFVSISLFYACLSSATVSK